MQPVHVSMIWAMTPNRVIGQGGGMPWRIPRDMKWFRKQTLGQAVVMGRGTLASWGGKPLKDRFNIVLTSDRSWRREGVEVVDSVSAALALCQERKFFDLIVIGGAEIYKSFLPLAERLYVTLVWSETEGDRHFPHYDERQWRVVWQEDRWRQGPKDSHPTRFIWYEEIKR